jgi:hypothetical protein
MIIDLPHNFVGLLYSFLVDRDFTPVLVVNDSERKSTYRLDNLAGRTTI